MKYIKLFNSNEELVNKIKSGEWAVPNVSYAESEDNIVFDEAEITSESNKPLWEALKTENEVGYQDDFISKYELSMVTDDDLFVTEYISSSSSSEEFDVSIFAFNSGLTTFTEFKDFTNITKVKQAMFRDCTGLKNVILPKQITKIEGYSFMNCINLESVNIPAGVTEIDPYAFYNCVSLGDVTIPAGITTISASTFELCDSFADAIIPEGVTVVGARAFANCSNMDTITLPSTLTSLKAHVFEGCASLVEIKFNGTTEQWNTLLANSSVYWSKNMSSSPDIVCSNGTLSVTEDDGAQSTEVDDGEEDTNMSAKKIAKA